MQRAAVIQETQESFIARFEQESRRNSSLVNASVGNLEITVLEAQNLPSNLHPLSVKLSYGDHAFVTHSVMSYGTEVSWSATGEEDVEENDEDGGFRRRRRHLTVALNRVSFDVDTLNIRGEVLVHIPLKALQFSCTVL